VQGFEFRTRLIPVPHIGSNVILLGLVLERRSALHTRPSGHGYRSGGLPLIGRQQARSDGSDVTAARLAEP